MPKISKRSSHELARLIEAGVHEVCNLPRPGLWFRVDELEVRGSPPSVIRAWATLTFTLEGSPYCCGEPGCHLGLFGERLDDLSEWMHRQMGLKDKLSIELGGRIAVNYLTGVLFNGHPGDHPHGTGVPN